jgi:UTP--glucose-1-phosphate uridylyltransferase
MTEKMEVKKAIIPVAGLGTRFLPLSLAVSKEFFPLVDKPVIQYIVEEVKKAGIEEIIFVLSPRQKLVLQYFKKYPDVEKVLVKRKKEQALKELQDFEHFFDGLKVSFVTQKDPLGDGHAILQAAKKTNGEAVANTFGDDVIDSEESAIAQLMTIFQTTQAPVLALKQIPRDKVPAYGMVVAEKIANRLYKIKKIVEKPDPSAVTSDLVIVGKHILTPEVFTYLKKAKPTKKGEIVLAEVFDKMLEEGKIIYGYEVKGEWLECGDKEKWIKSFFYMALKDPRYSEELKRYLKTIK